MKTIDWLNDWLMMRASGLAPRTVEQYRSLIASYLAPAFGDVDLAALAPSHVSRVISSLCGEGKSRTAQLCLVLLNSALKEAVSLGLIRDNPAGHVMRPRHVAADPRYWSPEEVHVFVHFCLDGGSPFRTCLASRASVRSAQRRARRAALGGRKPRIVLPAGDE